MSRRRSTRDVSEIATLVLSLGVVAMLVGGVAFVQLARGDLPPDVAATVSFDEVRAEGGRYYLPVAISNAGDQAAQAVRVVVVQRLGDRDREHELVIDYLAGHGSAEATAVLTEDPRRTPVTVEVRSFLRK